MPRCPWLPYFGLALAVVCSQLWAQDVKFSAPAINATVRGLVHVQATKPETDSGWIAFKIEGPGQKGDYQAAVSKPYVFDWDTLVRSNGDAVYPDGTYTVTASAFNPSSQPLGQATLTVTVNNALSGSDMPSSVRLRINYKRGNDYTYTIDAKRDVNLKIADFPALAPMVKEFNGI